MCPRTRLLHAFQLACAALAIGCSDSASSGPASTCAHAPKDLVGGWQSLFSLRACFAADHRMWIGATTYDLTSRSHCTTTADSCRFECTDLGGGDPYGGALDVSGDQLRVISDDCSLGPGACVGVYARDATTTCN